MDPNGFNWKSYINFLQNYHMPPSQNSLNRHPFPPSLFTITTTKLFYVKHSNPSTVNFQSSQIFPSIPPNNPTMVSNGEVGSQFSQFSTQIGLEEIIIEEIGGSSTKRKSRVVFAIEEDTHLISS